MIMYSVVVTSSSAVTIIFISILESAGTLYAPDSVPLSISVPSMVMPASGSLAVGVNVTLVVSWARSNEYSVSAGLKAGASAPEETSKPLNVESVPGVALLQDAKLPEKMMIIRTIKAEFPDIAKRYHF